MLSGAVRHNVMPLLFSLAGVGVRQVSQLLEHSVAFGVGIGQFRTQLFGDFGSHLFQRGETGFAAQEFLNVSRGSLAVELEGIFLFLGQFGVVAVQGSVTG